MITVPDCCSHLPLPSYLSRILLIRTGRTMAPRKSNPLPDALITPREMPNVATGSALIQHFRCPRSRYRQQSGCSPRACWAWRESRAGKRPDTPIPHNNLTRSLMAHGKWVPRYPFFCLGWPFRLQERIHSRWCHIASIFIAAEAAPACGFYELPGCCLASSGSAVLAG